VEATSILQTEKRGIYVHIPFCSKICSYCDYFVLPKNNQSLDQYLDALDKEVTNYCVSNSSLIGNSSISSLYIGGGTPSLLNSEQMHRLITIFRSHFIFDQEIEITTESNPASLDIEKLEHYRSGGINRISIGVQSFIKRELGVLKRNHSPKKAMSVLKDAMRAGFDSVNLDIIFSIPGQTEESLSYTLETALELGTNHFSAYSLIYEPGTPLYEKWKQGKIVRITDDDDARYYEQIQEILVANGLDQYEVSNFSQPGKQCQHNLHAWHGKEYFAFGVSSHGYLKGERFSNHRNLKKWLSDINAGERPIAAYEKIDQKARIEENIFLPLRADGISSKRFELNTGQALPIQVVKKLEQWQQSGHIGKEYHDNDTIFRLTNTGYKFCDTITLSVIEAFSM